MRPISEFIKAMWIMVKWGIPVLLATAIFSGIVGLILMGVKALLELVAPTAVGPFEGWMMIIEVISLTILFVFFASIAAHRALRELDKASEEESAKERLALMR